MDFKILVAEKSDAKQLSELKKEVWETTYRGIYPDTKIDEYDFDKNRIKFQNLIENKEIVLYVVKIGEKIIAYMSVGKPIREFGDYKQEIGLFYILKEYQRQGLGRRLFEIAYNQIKEYGCKKFFISCNKFNLPAQEFYKKMGGKIVHTDEDCEDKSNCQVKFHYDVI